MCCDVLCCDVMCSDAVSGAAVAMVIGLKGTGCEG